MREFNSRDHFESVYLKAHLAKKIKTPVSEKELVRYDPIIKRTVFIYFTKNRTFLSKLSMDMEDITSIAYFYAHIFLSTYNTPEYFAKYKEFSKEEVARKHRNNLIRFLRQKLSYLTISFLTKTNNVVGEKNRRLFFSVPSNVIINDDPSYIINNYRQLGLKKITKKQYLEKTEKDRFLKIELSNREFISLDNYTNLVDNGKSYGDSNDNFIDIIPSNMSFFSLGNINPYTASAEECMVNREDEMEMFAKEERMKDPAFIKKVLKTDIRFRKKFKEMLLKKYDELQNLG